MGPQILSKGAKEDREPMKNDFRILVQVLC